MANSSKRVLKADYTEGLATRQNYNKNPLAIRNTGGYATYADAAGAAPVDGTGGSPTVTLTATSSSPLRNLQSFLITKDAANRQGEGASYDFTIDTADQAKVMNISFDYAIASGTFVGGSDSAVGDLVVYIYDVTNAAIIQPSGFKVLGSVSGQNYLQNCQFQTASNSTSYRLIWHVATTSASAWTFKFTNVQVNTQITAQGSVATDWVQYTPTFTGLGTATSVSVWSRRVGDSLQIRGTFSTGTVTAATASITLGYAGTNSNISLDTTKVASGVSHIGQWASGASTGNFQDNILVDSTATGVIRFGYQNGSTGGLTAQLGNAAFGSTTGYSFFAQLPIAGWSALNLLSQDNDGRIVAARIGGDPASATSGNPIIFPTASYDTHGAYNASSGRYTAPQPGFYRVHGFITSATATIGLAAYVNAVSIISVGQTDSNGECAFSGTVQVNAGDLIDLRPNGTLDVATGSTLHFERMSGLSQIATSETVTARYFASGTSLSGSLATISWTTKDFDSHSAMSSGSYTVPAPGKYQVNAALLISGTIVLNTTAIMEIQKNGTAVSRNTQYAGGSETNQKAWVSDIIQCVSGDVLTIKVSSSATGPAIVSSNFDNYMSLVRVGN